MSYTLGEAAKAAGVSKTSVRRAMDSGKISAVKDDFGRWQIEPAELHRIYPPKTGTDTGTDTGNSQKEPNSNSSNSALQVEVKLLREMIDDLKKERGKWEEQSNKWEEQSNKVLITYETDKKAALERVEQVRAKEEYPLWLKLCFVIIIGGLALILLRTFAII